MRISGITFQFGRKPDKKRNLPSRTRMGRYQFRRWGGLPRGSGILVLVCAIVPLALLIQIPPENFSILTTLAVILLTLLLMPLLHEGMHLLPYWKIRSRVTLCFYWFPFGGYTRLQGGVDYRRLRKSLLLPLLLAFPPVVGIIGFGAAGELPMAFHASVIALIAALACTVDVYWALQIRRIGLKGRYYDRGTFLDVVWREEE